MSKISKIDLQNFTAFRHLTTSFSGGINIIIGVNGTGKTHILKLIYAACSITDGEDKEKPFSQKLVGVFQPFEGRVGRLSHRGSRSVSSSLSVYRERNTKLSASFSNHTKDHTNLKVTGEEKWKRNGISCAFIPVKEMLSHAPGFLSMALRREIFFEDIYPDIIKRAYLPKLKGPIDTARNSVLSALQSAIEGKVVTKGEYFFLKNKQGDLEFSLLSEGVKKLALVWLLTQNGVLTNGSALFWDEPEANLNPARMGEVVDVIIELQRIGVQIFVSTHNYVLLKEFDLRLNADDEINYISLYRDEDGYIQSNAVNSYSLIEENAIAETYNSIYDREVRKSIEKLKI